MGKVKPVLRPPLAVLRTGKQPVDHPLVCLGPLVGQE